MGATPDNKKKAKIDVGGDIAASVPSQPAGSVPAAVLGGLAEAVKTAQLAVGPAPGQSAGSAPSSKAGDLAKQVKNVQLAVDSGSDNPATPERRPAANSPTSARTIAYPVGGSSAAGGDGGPVVVLPTTRGDGLETAEMAEAFVRRSEAKAAEAYEATLEELRADALAHRQWATAEARTAAAQAEQKARAKL